MEIRTDCVTRFILAMILVVLTLQLADVLTRRGVVAAESWYPRYQISAYGTRWGSGYYLVDTDTGEVQRYHHRPQQP